MTDLDKDYKFYKAKEWFDRPAYYVERGEVVDKGHTNSILRPTRGNQGFTEKNPKT